MTLNKKSFEVAIKLGAQLDSSVRSAFAKTNKQISGMASKVGSVAKTAAKTTLALGAMASAAVGAGIAMSNKFAGVADDIDKASLRAGVNTTYLQEMRYAMGQVGVSSEDLQKGLQKMNQGVGLAKNGNKLYIESLKKVGISQEDISSGALTTEEAFSKSIRVLGDIKDTQERAALASELFGAKLANQLLPAAAAGGDGMKDLMKRAHELGLVIGKDGVAAGVLWGDTMDDFKKSMAAAGVMLGARFLPVFQKMLAFATNKMPAFHKVVSIAFDGISEGFTFISTNASKAFNYIKDKFESSILATINFRGIIKTVGDYIKSAFEMAKPYISWIAETGLLLVQNMISNVSDKAIKFYEIIKNNWGIIGPIILGVASSFATLKGINKGIQIFSKLKGVIKIVGVAFGKLGTFLGLLASPIGIIVIAVGVLVAGFIILYKRSEKFREGVQKLISGIAEFGKQIYAAVAPAIKMMVEAFKNLIAQIKPIITMLINVIASIVTFLKPIIAFVLNIFVKVFVAGFKTMVTVVTSVITTIINIVTSIISIFTGVIQFVKGVFTGNWSMAFEGIKAIFSGFFSYVGGIFGGLIDLALTPIRFIANLFDVDFGQFVTGVFTRVKDGALAAFEMLKSGLGSIFDGLVSVIKMPINGLIAIMNGLMGAFEWVVNGIGSAVNKIPKIKIPDWVPGLGGKEFGIPEIPKLTMPKIPMLAKGGVTTGPTMAMIGEGAEQEAVLPLSRLEALINEPKKKDPRGGGGGTVVFKYEPTFVVGEKSDLQTMQKTSKLSFEEFKTFVKKYEKERNRLSFE